jgi:hypothetical protein
VLSASVDYSRLLIVSTPLSDVHRLSFPYHGIPGKGSAFRLVFLMAQLLGAKACAVVDSDLRSITPEWIDLLIHPVLHAGYDFVAPYYHRHEYDGAITNSIVCVPPLMVAVVILAVAYLLAKVVRWAILRVVKGISLGRFPRESGLPSILDWSGPMRGVSMVAGTAFWVILGVGLLAAVDVFDTKPTSQAVESTEFLFPKLLTAGVILVVGFWLARYLSGGILVWTFDENILSARRLAALVIFVGALALAPGLGVGFGVQETVRKFVLQQRERQSGESEKSLWNHL